MQFFYSFALLTHGTWSSPTGSYARAAQTDAGKIVHPTKPLTAAGQGAYGALVLGNIVLMEHQAPSPEHLLVRTAAADRRAFHALYQLCAPQMFAVLLRILPRRDIAEEALQDAFVRIWQQAGSYRESKGRALTWMITIARNRALDILRRQHGEQALPQEVAEAEPQPATTEHDPVLAAQWTADSARLRHCMDELEASQANSIRLAYLRGYSHSEVATSLAAPLGTVKSWIRRGLASLKDCVNQ